MAKKPNGKAGRGISKTHYYKTPTANVPTLLRPTLLTVAPDNILGDRRVYEPDRRVKPLAAVKVNATRIVVADRFGDAVRRQTKAALRFNVPEKVYLCARRERRKEVLHAFNKTGRGVSRKKPRRNFWSSISCKR